VRVDGDVGGQRLFQSAVVQPDVSVACGVQHSPVGEHRQRHGLPGLGVEHRLHEARRLRDGRRCVAPAGHHQRCQRRRGSRRRAALAASVRQDVLHEQAYLARDEADHDAPSLAWARQHAPVRTRRSRLRLTTPACAFLRRRRMADSWP
jgi:hypothetical protein